VAFLNMTDPSQDCPSGWNLTSHSVRTCGRASHRVPTCDPVTFPVSGGEYSRVCGRVRGYQYGPAIAFGVSSQYQSLDSAYVHGISITHGPPHQRQHIWTYAVGLAQQYKGLYSQNMFCKCTANGAASPPPFVGDAYSCQSGVRGRWRERYQLHSSAPLWEGQSCRQRLWWTKQCCEERNPPHFVRDLPAPTTDGIEVRLCSYYFSQVSDVPLEIVELYVQ